MLFGTSATRAIQCGDAGPLWLLLQDRRRCQAEDDQLKLLVRRRCAVSTGGEERDSR